MIEPAREDIIITRQMLPSRKPVIHRGVDAPACGDCQRRELVFFDPSCEGCQKILKDPGTTISELFAILRQWTPQTQHHIDIIIHEILRRGAHIDDRDGLTDMTLLHYASKAGAKGIGDPEVSAKSVGMLLSRGAYPDIRCRWTHMSPLHYAVYFDVAPVITTLLAATHSLDIDSVCSEFDQGSSLHIAAANLSMEAVKVLLQHGADMTIVDNLGRTPLDCVPDAELFAGDSEMTQMVNDMTSILSLSSSSSSVNGSMDRGSVTLSKVTLQAMDMKIGDRIVVGALKSGTLRFCGSTQFAAGIWAGIELDEPVGKNDGTVAGVTYFTAPMNHGIFAPISKITKPGAAVVRSSSVGSTRRSQPPSVLDVSHVTAKVDTGNTTQRSSLAATRSSSVGSARKSLSSMNAAPMDVSHVSAKVDTGLHRLTNSVEDSEALQVGDHVVVAGKRKGVIKFIGTTQFAPGQWYGIELHRREGKNDGSVNGTRYFTCQPRYGVFSPASRIKKLSTTDFGSSESVDVMSLSEHVSRRSSANNSFKNMTSSVSGISPLRVKSAPHQSIVRTPGASCTLQLCVGTTVFCNGGMGVVRYIGPTNFADGVWVGVELRSARGKNDGMVQGHRYFTCKPGHGVLVRPNKISVRGINGTALLSNYVPPSSK